MQREELLHLFKKGGSMCDSFQIDYLFKSQNLQEKNPLVKALKVHVCNYKWMDLNFIENKCLNIISHHNLCEEQSWDSKEKWFCRCSLLLKTQTC